MRYYGAAATSPTAASFLAVFGIVVLFAIGYKFISYYQRYAGWPGYMALAIACSTIWGGVWLLLYKSALAISRGTQSMHLYDLTGFLF